MPAVVSILLHPTTPPQVDTTTPPQVLDQSAPRHLPTSCQHPTSTCSAGTDSQL